MIMDSNINFCGIMILLRVLQNEKILTEKEARAIAVRIAVETGVTVQSPL